MQLANQAARRHSLRGWCRSGSRRGTSRLQPARAAASTSASPGNKASSDQVRGNVKQPRRRPKQQQQRRQGQQPLERQPPSEVLSKVWASQSAEQVLQLAEDEGKKLKPAVAASMLSTLARLLRDADAGKRQQARQHPAFPLLFSALQRGAPRATGEQVVKSLQQFAWLELQPPESLLSELTQQLVQRLPTVPPAEACCAAWALTRLEYGGRARLLTAIGEVVQAQLDFQQAATGAQDGSSKQPGQRPQPGRQQRQQRQLDAEVPAWLSALPPSSLVILLWACAKAAFCSPPLLTAISRALRGGGLRQLKPQDLALLLYSLGALSWTPDRQFLLEVSEAVLPRLPYFDSQGLTNAVWGISKLPHDAHLALQPLAAAVAAEAAARLGTFRATEFSILVTSLAMPGPAWQQERMALLSAVAQELPGKVRLLCGRDLVGILSAFATVNFEPPTRTLDAAARQLSALLPAVPPASLCWLVWALAHMSGWRPPRPLLRKVEAALRGQAAALYELDTAALARLCWGLSVLKYYSGALLAELASVSRGTWERMDPQSMAMILYSYTQQQFTPHELLDAAAEHLAANLERYDPQSVAVLMWSFGKLGVHPGRGLPGGGPCTQDGTPLMTAVADHATRHMLEVQTEQQQQQQQQQPVRQPPAVCGRQTFSLQSASMLLWAFATLEHHPGSQLLQAVSQRFVAALRERTVPAVGGHATAAAAAGAQLAPSQRHAAVDAPWMQPVAIAAWSFSRFGFPDDAFFQAVLDCLPSELPAQQQQDGHAQQEQQLVDCQGSQQARQPEQVQWQEGRWAQVKECQPIPRLAFAAAKLRVAAAPQLLQRMLPAAQARLHEFGGEELCLLLWALAHAGLQPPLPFLDAAAAHLAARLAHGMGAGSSATADARLLCMAVHALAGLGYRADDRLLDGCVGVVAAAGSEVSVSLLAKLIWGCAHVGYQPGSGALEAIAGDMYHRLSHSRGKSTVLNVSDMVHLLWGLAALQQYGSQLYRNVAFRATRLPDGVPAQPRLRRLLREATVLHSCEHRLDPVAASAAAAILPAWMAGSGTEGLPDQRDPQQQQQQQLLEEQESAVHGGSWAKSGAAQVEPPAAAAAGAAAGAGAWAAVGDADEPGVPRPLELRRDAEAACRTLQRGGLAASLKQLSFGDYIVVFELGGATAPSSSTQGGGWRPRQGAVVPAAIAGRAAVNAPSQLLGSAMVAQRVLLARGLPVVAGSCSEAELLEQCRGLMHSS